MSIFRKSLLLLLVVSGFVAFFYVMLSPLGQNRSGANLPLVKLLPQNQLDYITDQFRFDVGSNSVLRCKFQIINNLQHPLSEIHLIPSCGCSRAIVSKSSLMPGEIADIELTTLVNATSRGESVTITTGEGLAYLIRCNYSEKSSQLATGITASPQRCLVEEPTSFVPFHTAIRVKISDKVRWPDVLADVSGDGVATVAWNTEIEPDGTRGLNVSINRPVAGPVNEHILLFTTRAPHYSTGIAVPIAGFFRSNFTVLPSIVDLGLVETVQKTQTVIKIRSESSTRKISCRTSGEWRVLETLATDSSGELTVIVGLPDVSKPGKKHGKLIINYAEDETSIPSYIVSLFAELSSTK